MQVTNIGVIVKNNYGDTLPVSLSQEAVHKIKMVLAQMQATSKVITPNGEVATPTIPIIPRKVPFDWERAYGVMTQEEKEEAFKVMMEGYAVIDKALSPDDPDGKVVNLKELIENAAEDKLNPFEMKLKGEGRANVDLEEKNELEVTAEDTNPERKDCTVEAENLTLGAKTPNPGE